MELNETILVSGRIVAEFEDDATQFLAGAAEFVHTRETTEVIPAITADTPLNDAVQAKAG